MAVRRVAAAVIGTIALIVTVTPLETSSAFAADLGVYVAPVPSPDGVPCDSPAVETFPSVWLGHFSGGRAYYPGPGAPGVLLDWRDEKLCFPSNRTCNRHVGAMRRAFHRPEGYFTCLPIR